MKSIFKKINTLLLIPLLLASPLVANAKIRTRAMTIDQDNNTVTVSVSLDRIRDITGCDDSICDYWQIHFQEEVESWGRYFSSDVYPATQLSATYTFHLPPGIYGGVFLAGYKDSDIGYCGFNIPGDALDSCPDGNRILSNTNGLAYLGDPDIIYPLTLGEVAQPIPVFIPIVSAPAVQAPAPEIAPLLPTAPPVEPLPPEPVASEVATSIETPFVSSLIRTDSIIPVEGTISSSENETQDSEDVSVAEEPEGNLLTPEDFQSVISDTIAPVDSIGDALMDNMPVVQEVLPEDSSTENVAPAPDASIQILPVEDATEPISESLEQRQNIMVYLGDFIKNVLGFFSHA